MLHGKRSIAQRRYASLNELNDDELKRITQTSGIDAATALLYDAVRSAPQNRQLIERLESREEPKSSPAGSTSQNRDRPRRVLSPAFSRGQMVDRIVELAARTGLATTEVLPLPSFAPMAQNAQMLVDFLAGNPSRPTILVSLSKGGSDVSEAMRRPDASEATGNASTWVNLSGIVTGTPLVARLKAQRLRCMGVRLPAVLRGQLISRRSKNCSVDPIQDLHSRL